MKPTIYRPNLRGRATPPAEDPAERTPPAPGSQKDPKSNPSIQSMRRSSGSLKAQS
jgi:hypothetical protein